MHTKACILPRAPRTVHLAPRTSHLARRAAHLAPRTVHLAPRISFESQWCAFSPSVPCGGGRRRRSEANDAAVVTEAVTPSLCSRLAIHQFIKQSNNQSIDPKSTTLVLAFGENLPLTRVSQLMTQPRSRGPVLT